jgi:carbon monoxide dehydrogenase subunit G
MVDVTVNTRVPAAVQQVWDTIGKFGALADWHPAVVSSETEDGGKKRRLTLVDGSQILEELVAQDEGSHTYTYTIVQPGPMPVQNYEATIKVEDDGQGNSKVTWSGQFEPTSNPDDARKAVENVYQTGLENLKKMMGG